MDTLILSLRKKNISTSEKKSIKLPNILDYIWRLAT